MPQECQTVRIQIRLDFLDPDQARLQQFTLSTCVNNISKQFGSFDPNRLEMLSADNTST